jgi:hypothetical protein
VPDAEVRVETWELAMPGMRKVGLRETFATRTDRDGRWSVPPLDQLVFVIPVPEGPEWSDDYTFRDASGRTATRILGQGEGPAEALRAIVEPTDPWTGAWFPALGVAIGGRQKASMHLGAAVMWARRRGLGLGARADVTPGLDAFSAAAGLLVSPKGGFVLFPGLELNVRWLRPWQVDVSRGVEFGPELGINLLNLRFTLSSMGPGWSTDSRQAVVSIGVGYL